MRCPNCATELPDTAKFCLECGRDLRPRPGFASPAAYTPKHLAERILTTRAALTGEHKQVTVLFCDIANSTPLAEQVGPERMHALLNGFFELALAEVHRYEGTINQFLGDGFMALFGAPLAHEDDARRAVRAAVAIRRALRDRGAYAGLGAGARLTVRIGLNTGLVVVGSIGDNLRMDYTAVGDTTNVAARLQQSAAPGEIVIAEATARQVRSDVRLAAAGAIDVKGKSEPVVAYKVLGLAPPRSAFERAAERAFGRFVGRDAELQRLGGLLAAAHDGRGRLVRVVGEAGSGKSRLVYELRRTLSGAELTTLEARCRSYGGAIPYLPILDLVRGQCGIEEIDPPDVIGDKLRGTLTTLGLDVSERAPFLLHLLGVKVGDVLEDLAPEFIRARTVEALQLLLLEGARRRPLLVVIEDLHWIDDASEEYLGTLVDGLATAPVLMVATHRPDWRPRWTDGAGAEEIALAPLGESASLALVEGIVARAALSEALVRAILDRASGNPLFLEELARAVAEQGDLAAAHAVPDTLRAVLGARLDRLPDVLKRLLQTAAVLGREFSRGLLETLWDGPGGVAAHLAELARLDFVHELTAGDDPTFAFNHALTQEVAYESLLTAQRQALHEAAARTLEAAGADRGTRASERLAYHWTHTPHADRAVAALRRLAARAVAAYANADAVAALDEAETRAAELGAERERVILEIALERAQAQFSVGQLPAVIADLESRAEAVGRLGDASLTAQYHLRLAASRGMLGQTERAIADAEQALAEAEAIGDVVTAGKAHYVLTRECFWSSAFARGAEHGRLAIARLQGGSERWWLAMTNWMRALNFLELGRFDEALGAAAWTASIADQIGDARLASYSAWVGGWVRTSRGDWTTGIEAGRRALASAPDEMSRGLAEGFLGIGHVEHGQPEVARPLLEHATAVFRQMSFVQLEGLFTIFQAEAALLENDDARARELITRGRALVEVVPFIPAIATAHAVQGELSRRRGDLDAAERQLTEALALTDKSEARYRSARLHLLLAALARERGDTARASQHRARAHTLFVEMDAPVWAARAAEVSDQA
jgi:class 3 adenylate cyclase/tetratricopeptide (TPR) repeat protein